MLAPVSTAPTSPLVLALPLAGLRIGYITRVSTAGQDGNYSTLEQDEAVRRYIERQGGEAIAYHEGAVSGRDLSKRRVALQMLEDADNRILDGVGAYDLKRLSRDEYGADPALILRRLAKRRALLILHDRVIRPWDKDDRTLFQIQAALAGRDVIDIRDTFWRGLHAKARKEPFFMNKPPFGYAVEIEEVADGAGGRTKLVRRPIKDPACIDAFADIINWLDLCPSLGEVCRRFNAKYRDLMPLRRGEKRSLYPGMLRSWLSHSLYSGVWTFGRQRGYKNDLWDIDGRRERAEQGEYRHERPDLAYWTEVQALAWRRKFQGYPGPRARKYVHPLIGVLSCANCGQPLIGAGRHGYRCPGQIQWNCTDPQTISERLAPKLIRSLIPEVFERLRGRFAEEVRRQIAKPDARLEDARRALAAKRGQLDALKEDWYGDEAVAAGLRPDLDIRKRMSELAEEVDRLSAEVEKFEASADASQIAADQLQAALDVLDHGPDVFDYLDDDAKAFVIRTLLKNVRVRGHGRKGGRTHSVEGFDLAIEPGGNAHRNNQFEN